LLSATDADILVLEAITFHSGRSEVGRFDEIQRNITRCRNQRISFAVNLFPLVCLHGLNKREQAAIHFKDIPRKSMRERN